MAAGLTLIAQVDEAWGLADDNGIPWGFSRRDRFDQLTAFHAIIMGRRTAEMLAGPERAPLKNRLSIVLTSPGKAPIGFHPNVVYVGTWEMAVHIGMTHANKLWQDDVFVAGGVSVFKKARAAATGALLTRISGLHGCSYRMEPFGSLWRREAALDDFEVWRRRASRELTAEEKRKKHAWRAISSNIEPLE